MWKIISVVRGRSPTPNVNSSTVSLSTEYHRPFKAGMLKAEGTVTKWGRTLCYAKATLFNGFSIAF